MTEVDRGMRAIPLLLLLLSIKLFKIIISQSPIKLQLGLHYKLRDGFLEEIPRLIEKGSAEGRKTSVFRPEM